MGLNAPTTFGDLLRRYRLAAGLIPRQELTVRAVKADVQEIRFPVLARLDTPVEVTYYQQGGIPQAVLRQLVSEP